MNEEKRNQQHIEVIVKINKPDEDCIEVPIDRDLDCKYDNYDNHNNLNDLHEYASLNPEVCENGIKMSSKHRKHPDTSGNNSRMDYIERHSLSLGKKGSKLNDSENIKIQKIKAVNNLENSAGEILMCDVDVAMLSERLPPPPTFHDTTHQLPSSSCQTSSVCLVDTIPSSSGTDATAFGPANGMTHLNTDAIREGNRLMLLHSILDSVTVVEQ
ncbi:hypothetical protein CWI39_1388p0010, partial [Hamiltosporidium magnivora]